MHENAVIGEVKVGSAYFVRVVACTEALDSHVENEIEDSKGIIYDYLSYFFISDVRFDGKENLQNMARDYKIKYRCSFDVIILFII